MRSDITEQVHSKEARQMRRGRCLCARMTMLAMFLSAAAFAREISLLVVDSSAQSASVTFEAGSPGDSHVLYYVWSHDGIDKGTDPADWPFALRLGRVADSATSFIFTLPAVAVPSGQYAARAMLMTSSIPYD